MFIYVQEEKQEKQREGERAGTLILGNDFNYFLSCPNMWLAEMYVTS